MSEPFSKEDLERMRAEAQQSAATHKSERFETFKALFEEMQAEEIQKRKTDELARSESPNGKTREDIKGSFSRTLEKRLRDTSLGLRQMSDTPRTDAMVTSLAALGNSTERGEWINFARDLEREIERLQCEMELQKRELIESRYL